MTFSNLVLVDAMGWAFVDFLWQGLLVWAAAAPLLLLGSPRARYALGMGALALCLALPLSGIASRLGTVDPAPAEVLAAAPPATAVPFRPERPTQAASLKAALADRIPLVVLAWAAGACLLSLRAASGLAWVGRLRRRAAASAAPEWTARLERLQAAFGIRRRVQLKVAHGLASPLSFGAWRPVILLPASLVTGMDPTLLEALLAHELAHVRRLDYLANLFQVLVEIVLFYHPAVWWISHRVRLDRELVADALAAQRSDPRSLALALQALDLFQSTPTLAAQAAHGGHLMTRIRRLVHPEPRPVAWRGFLAIALGAAFCGAFATYARARAVDPPLPQAPRPASETATPEAVNPTPRSKGREGAARPDRAPSPPEQELTPRLDEGSIRFRSRGKAYVITDPDLVARAHALYDPLGEMGRKMGELGREMGKLGRLQGDIGREQGAGGREQGEIGRQMGEIGRQQGKLGREQGRLGREKEQLQRKLDDLSGPKEREDLERRMAALDATLAELDRKMEALAGPMEALSRRMEEAMKPIQDMTRRMEEAGRPMAELGVQMNELGRKMEAAGKEAKEGMRRLVEEALRKGKAVPEP